MKIIIETINVNKGEIVYYIKDSFEGGFTVYVNENSKITINNKNATLEELPSTGTPAEIILDEEAKTLVRSLNITLNNKKEN